MRRLNFAALAWLAIALHAQAAEDPFKLYPGATRYTPPETEQDRQFASALRPGTTITADLTNDSLEKVVAFNRAIGKEYTPAKKPAADQLPHGQRLFDFGPCPGSGEFPRVAQCPTAVRGRTVGEGRHGGFPRRAQPD